MADKQKKGKASKGSLLEKAGRPAKAGRRKQYVDPSKRKTKAVSYGKRYVMFRDVEKPRMVDRFVDPWDRHMPVLERVAYTGV